MHRATVILILLVCLALYLNTGGGGLVQASPVRSARRQLPAVTSASRRFIYLSIYVFIWYDGAGVNGRKNLSKIRLFLENGRILLKKIPAVFYGITAEKIIFFLWFTIAPS